jgi:hypothetical protein
MQTTVIHHSADYDGIFCREIARKFLPDAELIGWDFSDPPLALNQECIEKAGQIYILDLPIDRPFGLKFGNHPTIEPLAVALPLTRIVWIDHHKSSIETHPTSIPGYRIDGVAACRLAWQWLAFDEPRDDCHLPFKQSFIDRIVKEPLAVRLAGEYDIWDKRDPDAELFQHGLRSRELKDITWKYLLGEDKVAGDNCVADLLEGGKVLQYSRAQENASIIKAIGFTMRWEGLMFLCCNSARYNSHLFTAGLTPDHDACFGFKWTGKTWSISLYHAPGKEHYDLSKIAVKYGGGGHKGACGFQTEKLPFMQ